MYEPELIDFAQDKTTKLTYLCKSDVIIPALVP